MAARYDNAPCQAVAVQERELVRLRVGAGGCAVVLLVVAGVLPWWREVGATGNAWESSTLWSLTVLCSCLAGGLAVLAGGARPARGAALVLAGAALAAGAVQVVRALVPDEPSATAFFTASSNVVQAGVPHDALQVGDATGFGVGLYVGAALLVVQLLLLGTSLRPRP